MQLASTFILRILAITNRDNVNWRFALVVAMDFADSTTTSPLNSLSVAHVDASQEEHYVTPSSQDHETACWACGVRLLLSPYAAIFKCGWCGAISNHNAWKCVNKYFRWRRFRDRCFVSIVLLFMFFMICGSIWAIYPLVFSISYFCGFFHSLIAVILSVSTLSMFSLAAFRCAGASPSILWGSYSVVGNGGLENYTFCNYCSKPKSPRTHHCRSCGMCVLDMDHHCPFIGNCIGAANHRCFILFLISAVISTIYISIMSAYAVLNIWPPLTYRPRTFLNELVYDKLVFRTMQQVILAFLRSTVFLSARGLVLVYLFIASVSVEIGLSVLLWQQLCYIYKGDTYLSLLSSHGNNTAGQGDRQNIIRFFGCQYSRSRYLRSFPPRNFIRFFRCPYSTSKYLPCFWNSKKSYRK